MAKITLDPITGSFASVTALNSRFQQVEDAFNDNVFWRLNIVGEPNTLSNDLDVNNNDILNLNAPLFNHSPARLQDVLDASASLVSTSAVATTLTDSGGFYTSSNVEGALAEIYPEFSSEVAGKGSSLVGIEDAGGYYTATEVEAALQELKGQRIATGSFTTALISATSWTVVSETITHGLGTDDIDFGCTVIGSGAGIIPYRISVLIRGTDERYWFMNPNDIDLSSIPDISSPSSGDIEFSCFNGSGVAQTATVNWWARKR